MRIYSQVRLGVSPEINAICTLLIGMVALGVLAVSLVGKLRGGQGAGIASLGRAAA